MSKHRLKIFGLALVCLLFTAVLLQTAGPRADADLRQPQSAEALEVQAITVVPRLAAFGQAKPSRVWAAVAQSDGLLVWISPKIESGELVEKDEALFHLAESGPENGQSGTVNIVKAPFKGKAAALELEIGQNVASGKTVLTVESLDQAVITIGLSGEKLAMLTTSNSDKPQTAAEIRESLSQAWVEVAPKGAEERLPARLSSRSVSVNPGTGLVEASLVVDNLSSPEDLHQVFISGPPRVGQVVIPRSAIHDGEVFVADQKQRLKRRPVIVKYTLDNYAVIGQGLAPGETLIIGDVSSLRPGGQLDLRLDREFYRTAQSVLGPAKSSRPAGNQDLSPWITVDELAG